MCLDRESGCGPAWLAIAQARATGIRHPDFDRYAARRSFQRLRIPQDRTPNIDSFAQQGTVFTEVNSQIPLTLPSHTSLFTSTYPFENGIEENAEVVPAGAVTLASDSAVARIPDRGVCRQQILDRRLRPRSTGSRVR